jgi:hypothetical protein
MAALLLQRSIQELIKTVKALHFKVKQSADKTEQLETTLGLTLKEAKDKKPKGITWPDFVKEHFDFGRSRADQLIQIGEGRTTVEEVRTTTAERVQKSTTKSPIAIGGSLRISADAPKEDQGQSADAINASKLAAVAAKEQTAATKVVASKPQSAPAKTTKPDATTLSSMFNQIARVDSHIAAQMSDAERVDVIAQIARADAWLNEVAISVAVSGGAKLGALAPVSRLQPALEFLKAAVVRVEAALVDRAGGAVS